MKKGQICYIIDNNNIEPVTFIEESTSNKVHVKNLNNEEDYWIASYSVYGTKEEACEKLLEWLEYDKQEAEETIENLKDELAIINETIRKLKQKKMKFKGTIIITDPCYIVKKCTEKNPNPLPFTIENIKAPYVDEMRKQYNEWEDKHNDWIKCEYGQNMEALGISTYFTKDTIYGDWSCTTYEITENPYEVIDDFVEASKKGEDYGVNCSKLGDFCADAGLVSVFNLDEVRKYNPGIDEWIAAHNWCVTVVPDFEGEVDYYVDKQGAAHIIGVGNINFFTDQTGL